MQEGVRDEIDDCLIDRLPFYNGCMMDLLMALSAMPLREEEKKGEPCDFVDALGLWRRRKRNFRG